MPSQLFTTFTEERRLLKGVSEATLEWYKYSFRAFAPFLESCRDEQQLKSALKTGVMSMADAGTNPITINDRIRCINAWTRWMKAEGHIAGDLRLEHLKEPQKVTPTLRPDEVKRVVAYRSRCYRERRAHAMACVILDCGLRIAEILSLTCGDADLQNLLLKVRGKGNKDRVVPISLAACKLIFPFKKGKAPDQLVFSQKAGGDVEMRNSLRDLKIVYRKLGISGSRLAWHALRHTFAVNFIRAGGDVFSLQRILGHASLEMTKRYVNLQTEDLKLQHRNHATLLSQ